MQANKKNVVNIVVDTNIVYHLIGSYKKKGRNINGPYKRLPYQEKLMYLSLKGHLNIFVTPQVFIELTVDERGPAAQELFNNFLRDFITVIDYEPSTTEKVSKLAYRMGNELVDLTDNYTGETYKTILFKDSKSDLCRNFADTRIMAEAVFAKMPIITMNTKDFQGHKALNVLLNKYDYKLTSQPVFKPQKFLDINFPHNMFKDKGRHENHRRELPKVREL